MPISNFRADAEAVPARVRTIGGDLRGAVQHAREPSGAHAGKAKVQACGLSTLRPLAGTRAGACCGQERGGQERENSVTKSILATNGRGPFERWPNNLPPRLTQVANAERKIGNEGAFARPRTENLRADVRAVTSVFFRRSSFDFTRK
ncbi:unnamed protein product [Prorocentrum cordatum]|uniref:Uncharacterized protein n=1 Tax=Prorocentrum cordatum TaxID=2364126 RepID=A0ABN9ST78_9DINO|nr:unnamed protein product [Polarella glacialis]